jgi:hypothetical protein
MILTVSLNQLQTSTFILILCFVCMQKLTGPIIRTTGNIIFSTMPLFQTLLFACLKIRLANLKASFIVLFILNKDQWL